MVRQLVGADARHAAVLPQAAAVLLDDRRLDGDAGHQRVGRQAGLAARRHRLRAGRLSLPAPLGWRSPRAPGAAGAAHDTALLWRRAIRQPGHAGRGLHRRHHPVRRPCRAGRRRRSPAPPCACRRLCPGGARPARQGADRSRHPRHGDRHLARGHRPAEDDPAPGLAAGNGPVRHPRATLVRGGAGAISGVLQLFLPPPPLRALHDAGLQQPSALLVPGGGVRGRHAALVRLPCRGRAQARAGPGRQPVGPSPCADVDLARLHAGVFLDPELEADRLRAGRGSALGCAGGRGPHPLCRHAGTGAPHDGARCGRRPPRPRRDAYRCDPARPQPRQNPRVRRPARLACVACGYAGGAARLPIQPAVLPAASAADHASSTTGSEPGSTQKDSWRRELYEAAEFAGPSGKLLHAGAGGIAPLARLLPPNRVADRAESDLAVAASAARPRAHRPDR